MLLLKLHDIINYKDSEENRNFHILPLDGAKRSLKKKKDLKCS